VRIPKYLVNVLTIAAGVSSIVAVGVGRLEGQQKAPVPI